MTITKIELLNELINAYELGLERTSDDSKPIETYDTLRSLNIHLGFCWYINKVLVDSESEEYDYPDISWLDKYYIFGLIGYINTTPMHIFSTRIFSHYCISKEMRDTLKFRLTLLRNELQLTNKTKPMRPKPEMKSINAAFQNKIQQAASSMKPPHFAPVIVDTILDDNGETILVLDNGRTTTQDAYDRQWKPSCGNSEIKHQHYKGENPGNKWNR